MPSQEIPAKNKLYYGDNLAVLRDDIPNQADDAIYLDPGSPAIFDRWGDGCPLSRQDYNVLFDRKITKPLSF